MFWAKAACDVTGSWHEDTAQGQGTNWVFRVIPIAEVLFKGAVLTKNVKKKWKIEFPRPPEAGNRLGVLKKLKLSYIFDRSEVCEKVFFWKCSEFSRGCSRFFRRELTPKMPKSRKKSVSNVRWPRFSVSAIFAAKCSSAEIVLMTFDEKHQKVSETQKCKRQQKSACALRAHALFAHP